MPKRHSLTRRLLRAVPWLILSALIVFAYFSASQKGLQAQACTKGGEAEHEYCADYNIVVAYALRGLGALDTYNGAVTALATIAIAWFTLTLMRATREHSDIHERLTTITDRQTEIAERAMTIGDEPRLLVRYVSITTLIGRSGKMEEFFPSAVWTTVVIGNTPAILRAHFDEIRFAADLPKVPEDRKWSYVSEMKEKDSSWSYQTYVRDDISEADSAAMQGLVPAKSQWKFFLIGGYVYDDTFGNQHEYRFCYRCSIGRSGVVEPYGGATYNYRRLRKPEEQI